MDAPDNIQLYYLILVVNVLLVDSVQLPNLRQATTQFVSITLALFSGEFFHVRILTASHLFILDLIFGYVRKDSANRFGFMPEKLFVFYDAHIRINLGRICSTICLLIFLWSILNI